MTKRTIINLLLIALVVALTWYVNKNPVTKSEPENFADIASSQVDTIVIQRVDEPELIFEKTDTGWIMTSPLEGRASLEKMSLLLKFLDLKSRHQHSIEKQKQLQRYALSEPQVSLFMNDQQFDFGSVNSFNKLRYVLHDNTVHSVKDITFHLLVTDAKSFLLTE